MVLVLHSLPSLPIGFILSITYRWLVASLPSISTAIVISATAIQQIITSHAASQDMYGRASKSSARAPDSNLLTDPPYQSLPPPPDLRDMECHAIQSPPPGLECIHNNHIPYLRSSTSLESRLKRRQRMRHNHPI